MSIFYSPRNRNNNITVGKRNKAVSGKSQTPTVRKFRRQAAKLAGQLSSDAALGRQDAFLGRTLWPRHPDGILKHLKPHLIDLWLL